MSESIVMENLKMFEMNGFRFSIDSEGQYDTGTWFASMAWQSVNLPPSTHPLSLIRTALLYRKKGKIYSLLNTSFAQLQLRNQWKIKIKGPNT